MWPKYLKFCPSGKISPYLVSLQKRRTGVKHKKWCFIGARHRRLASTILVHTKREISEEQLRANAQIVGPSHFFPGALIIQNWILNPGSR